MQLDQLRRRDFITLLVGSGAALGRSRRLNTQFEFLKRGNGMPRIVHIAIKVDDLEKATKFYEEVFDFRQTSFSAMPASSVSKASLASGLVHLIIRADRATG